MVSDLHSVLASADMILSFNELLDGEVRQATSPLAVIEGKTH